MNRYYIQNEDGNFWIQGTSFGPRERATTFRLDPGYDKIADLEPLCGPLKLISAFRSPVYGNIFS